MKKALRTLTAIAMALTLAACSSGGGDSSSQQTAASGGDAQTTETAATGDTAQTADTTDAATEEQTGSLVLYTSASTSEYELIVELFKEAYPDIDVEVVSAGTGELSARIVAEAANPKGDVLMGGGASTYLSIADQLEPYKTANADALVAEFMPEDGLYAPCYLNVNAIILNNSLMEGIDVTVDSWESLLDPALKGQIAFADPSAAGSAPEQVINMLATKSTDGTLDGGWAYVEEFVANLDGKIAAGSSDVYKGVVNGEYAVGLTNEDKVINYIQDGADVSVAYPSEGITLRTSNIAKIRGGANPYNAKLFIDFVTSKECQTQMESELCVRPARTAVPMTTPGRLETSELVSFPYPQGVDSSAIKTQFQDLITR